MPPFRTCRQRAAALDPNVERLLAVATIMAQQGEVRRIPVPKWRAALCAGAAPAWMADFPEAAKLRGVCRAAYGDPVLLAHVARMRLGKSGVTLLHRAAYVGDWVAAKAALLYAHSHELDFDRVDVGSEPWSTKVYPDGAPLTPLAMALDGKYGSSKDCVEMLLALGASPDRALKGLLSTRHSTDNGRPRTFDVALIGHVLKLASPDFSLLSAWDVGLMLRDPVITAAATRRLAEDPDVLAGEFDDRIEWDLNEFSSRYGAQHHELLRALAANLPSRFFSDILHAFASIKDKEALEAALDSDLAMLPANRGTALWAAAISGMLDGVKSLLDATVQIVSRRGPYSQWTTPLAAAVANRHLQIVEYLVMHQTPAQGTYAEKLQASVEMGLSERVQHLLTHHGGAIDLEAKVDDDDGMVYDCAPRYILVLACTQGRLDIVKLLVDAGASVHVGMDGKRDAPLTCWASGPSDYTRTTGSDVTADMRVELVKYLIKKGALYSAGQWAAFAVGKAHLNGLDVSRLDECEVTRRAVAELGLAWGAPWVA